MPAVSSAITRAGLRAADQARAMAGRAAVAATSAGRSDSSVAIGPSPGCSSLSGAVSGGLPEIAMLAHPPPAAPVFGPRLGRSEEHTSELQSLMRISYAVFCLKNKNTQSINEPLLTT